MSKEKLLQDAKTWIEQEKTWDDAIYATGRRSTRVAVDQNSGRPELQRKEVLIKGNHSQPLRSTAAPVNRSPGQPPLSSGKASALAALYERYKDCTRCPLGASRIKIVFGVGNPDSQVLFIGEGPGYDEDRRGEPFVGRAGQLLDKMMAAIGLSRQTNAYIANIVKCHPMTNPQTPDARGNDRPPTPEEVETCSPILLEQIAIIKPKVIMTLGSPSTKMVLHTGAAITGLRGKLVRFDVDHFYGKAVKIDDEARETLSRTQVLPTFHPAALLRNPNLKKDSWEDLKFLRDLLLKK